MNITEIVSNSRYSINQIPKRTASHSRTDNYSTPLRKPKDSEEIFFLHMRYKSTFLFEYPIIIIIISSKL